jgi:hypothetical protein
VKSVPHEKMDEKANERVNENLVLVLCYTFKILPVIVAAGAIYLGYRLFILGVTGKASLSLNTNLVSGQLINAAPGLFFAVGGLATIVITVWKGVDISFDKGGKVAGLSGGIPKWPQASRSK